MYIHHRYRPCAKFAQADQIIIHTVMNSSQTEPEIFVIENQFLHFKNKFAHFSVWFPPIQALYA